MSDGEKIRSHWVYEAFLRLLNNSFLTICSQADHNFGLIVVLFWGGPFASNEFLFE